MLCLSRRAHGVSVDGKVWLRGEGELRLGKRVRMDARAAPIELNVERGGVLELGDDVEIGPGASIEVQRLVTIGARSRIGAFSKTLDGHFHALEGDRSRRPPPGRVVVEDDVDVGPHAVLLPNAHIGRGSAVRAGAVVSRRFPDYSSIGGIPAAVRGRTRRSAGVDLSVIVAVTANGAGLQTALRSALSQTGPKLEVHVVDDSDGGGARDAALGDGDRRVSYMRMPLHEVGRAAVPANLGLAAARGDFVHFLPDSGVVRPGAYAEHVSALRDNPAATLTVATIARLRDSSTRTGKIELLSRLLFGGSPPATSGSIYRLEALLRAGGHDPQVGPDADRDLQLRVLRAGGSVSVDGQLVSSRGPVRRSRPGERMLRAYRQQRGDAEFWALRVLRGLDEATSW